MLTHILLLTLFLIVLPAFVPDSSPHRHTVCLISLTVFVTVLGIILFPVYVWRPCNPRNFRWSWPFMYLLSVVIGSNYRFSNTEVTKKVKKFIVIPNHQSYFDALGVSMVARYADRLAVIATKGVKYLGPMGFTSWLGGFIFIDRFKGGGYPNMYEQVKEHFDSAETGSILIFPEGRIGPGDSLLKFKSGPFRLAAELGVPVLPLVISKYHISSDETKFSRGKVLAEFLEPIYVSPDNIESAMTQTRDLMQKKYEELSQQVHLEHKQEPNSELNNICKLK